MREFLPSSAANPCPVCGRIKDADCRTKEQGNVVFCHTMQHASPEQRENGYRYIKRSDKGAGWGIWVWGEPKGKKEPRKVIEQTWFYQHRETGANHVAVCKAPPKRFSQRAVGLDGKIAANLDGVDRSAIALYRIADVRQAIKDGKPVYWCEGEKTADSLHSIGLCGTTTIGGSGGLSRYAPPEKYLDDLEGVSQVFIVPDRDKSGMEYADEIAKLLDKGGIKHSLIRVYPNSPLWEHLPESNGLDADDWIEEGATAKDFEKQHPAPSTQSGGGKYETLINEIIRIETEFKKDQARKYFELEEVAAKFKRSLRSIEKIYKLHRSRFEKATPMTMAEHKKLAAEQSEQNYIVANLLPLGTTVCFYAPAGTGKSLFVYDLIDKIHLGKPFLNRPIIRQPKTLVIQLDEPDRIMRDRFNEKGMLDHPNIETLNIFSFAQLDYLEELVEDRGYQLILIDNLTAAMKGSDLLEKDPDYGTPLFEIRDICQRHNATAIVIHHANKKGEIRGSTAIEANVSEVWKLRRYDREIDTAPIASDERVFEVTKFRDDTYQKSVLKIVPDGYQFLYVDNLAKFEEEGPNAPASLIDRIRMWFESNRETEVTVAELLVTQHFRNEKPDSMRKTVRRLYKQGYLKLAGTKSNPSGEPSPVYRYATIEKTNFNNVPVSQNGTQSYTHSGFENRDNNKDIDRDSDNASRYDIPGQDGGDTPCPGACPGSCPGSESGTGSGLEGITGTPEQDYNITKLSDRVGGNGGRNGRNHSERSQMPVNPYTGPQKGSRVRFVSNHLTESEIRKLRGQGQEPPWGTEGVVVDIDYNGSNGYFAIIESMAIRDKTLPAGVPQTHPGRIAISNLNCIEEIDKK